MIYAVAVCIHLMVGVNIKLSARPYVYIILLFSPDFKKKSAAAKCHGGAF